MRDKLPKMMNECRFLAAAKQSIEKSTFHALPWSIENIGWIPKVKLLFWENFITFPSGARGGLKENGQNPDSGSKNSENQNNGAVS